MERSSPRHQRLEARPLLLAALLLGFFLAVFGTYWDDAWHTEKGRDSFLVPPHLVLYAGISLAGVSLSWWATLSFRARGLRATMREPSLLLALIGVGTTLAAAPIDNGWHLAFGRDAVIWSPPHMLGVAGTLAIAAAMLLELSGSSSRLARLAAYAAGAGVLAAAAIPVLEYETDVPQFDVVLYLPVLTLGSAFALGLARRALGGSFPAGIVAAVHAAALVVVVLVLLLVSMPPPLVPALLIPALVLDWAARRRLAAPAAAALFAASLFAVYVPYLDLLKNDIFLGLSEVLLGLPAAFLAALVGLSAAGWDGSRGIRGSGAGVARVSLLGLGCLAALTFAPPAKAHDPGQGEQLTTAALTASSLGERAGLDVNLANSRHCRDIRPLRLVARRAGDAVTAGLSADGRCRFSGEVDLPARGRWFLYAELDHDGETVETWLPVHSGAEETVSAARSVYVPPSPDGSPLKWVSGGITYLVVLALVFAISRLYRAATGSVLAGQQSH